MKRFLPYLVLLLAALWLASSWKTPKPKADAFDLTSFSRIPVLVGGRIKPLDTVARNSLLIMRGKQSLRLPDGKGTLTATRWLADVLFNPTVADTYPVFAVANQDVLGMCGMPQSDKRYCTFAELRPHLQKIEEERKLVDGVESGKRTPFQSAIFNLFNSLIHYQQLKSSIHEEGTTGFGKEIQTYATAIAAGVSSIQPGATPLPPEQLNLLKTAVARYERQSGFSYMLTVAPPKGGTEADWLTTGNALIRVNSPQTIPASVSAFADMSDAFRANDKTAFANITKEYAGWLAVEHPEWSGRTSYELRFNQMEPFYQSMVLYVGAFLLACGSWLICPKELRKTAFLLLLLALLVHSFGMFSRMYLQGRPPVTNLYSSAIFVGWGAVLIGLVLERLFRDGIGAACAGMVGFITLIIAHHLGSNGDTLEMMQAVLDSNIWLATHVVIITAGYSAMFLAGFLAIAYVFLNLLASDLSKIALAKLGGIFLGIACLGYMTPIIFNNFLHKYFIDTFESMRFMMLIFLCVTSCIVILTFGLIIMLDLIGVRRKFFSNKWNEYSRNLVRMVYGIICFATLFSFVGTVLGGIWADQSWGRFWGWDPKENGALLIVLWCALILHARWGGYIRQRGLMAMAIFGNAITAFSWFGVNMLGVGLHSYGFMDKAFPWLLGFVISQFVLVAIAQIPLNKWRSFSKA